MFAQARMFGSLFLVALSIRAIGVPTVFSTIGVQLPYAGDAYYHLRRIWYSVARFPEVLSFDRYVSFPDGSQIIWPAAFDWTIAAVIRLFVDPTDQQAVESLAVWVPALLGAATTGVLALFANRFYGSGAGWLAGLLYCVLPMSFIFSQLGMVDHHVAVALLTTLMLWLVCENFDRDERAESWAAALVAPSARLGVAVGFAMAATISMWPGALIHVGLLQLAIGLRWLLAEDRAVARARALSFAMTQMIAAACLAPFTFGVLWSEYGSWSPLVLSSFQPVYLASAASMILAAQLLHEGDFFGASRGRRTASALGLAMTGVILPLIIFAPLREAIVFAGGWFTHGEVSLGLIFEMQPILATAGHFDPSFAIDRFGAAFIVLPLAWLYLARRAIETRSWPHGLILFWSLAFMALTLRQWRFGNTFAVIYVVLLGAVLAEWLQQLRRRIGERPLRPVLEISIILILVAWSGIAFSGFYRPILRKSVNAIASEEQKKLGPLHPARRIYDEAGRWIAEQTPKTTGYLDARGTPEYAVLANTSVGHLLRYRAERPMIQDNFGPYAGRRSFDAAAAYYASRDEEAAIEVLERLGVRYVVGGAGGAGSTAGLEPDAMALRLWKEYGSFSPRRKGRPVSGLSRHRLLFHADTASPRLKSRPLTGRRRFEGVGVWEIVSGATIEGRAEPGAVIRLSLQLATTSNAQHVYRRKAVTDDGGRYRFVVPYSTDVPFSPDVRALRPYRIESSRLEERLVVREEDVLSGEVIRGPDL